MLRRCLVDTPAAHEQDVPLARRRQSLSGQISSHLRCAESWPCPISRVKREPADWTGARVGGRPVPAVPWPPKRSVKSLCLRRSSFLKMRWRSSKMWTHLTSQSAMAMRRDRCTAVTSSGGPARRPRKPEGEKLSVSVSLCGQKVAPGQGWWFVRRRRHFAGPIGGPTFAASSSRRARAPAACRVSCSGV